MEASGGQNYNAGQIYMAPEAGVAAVNPAENIFGMIRDGIGKVNGERFFPAKHIHRDKQGGGDGFHYRFL